MTFLTTRVPLLCARYYPQALVLCGALLLIASLL